MRNNLVNVCSFSCRIHCTTNGINLVRTADSSFNVRAMLPDFSVSVLNIDHGTLIIPQKVQRNPCLSKIGEI